MKSLFLILMFTASSVLADSTFDTHFEDATLRIDFYHSGNAETQTLTFDRAFRQGPWAGPRRTLLDPFPYGSSLVRVFDLDSGEEIFSKGFDTYFSEYRTTAPAHQGQSRTFHESVLLPFPKHPIRVTIEFRGQKAVSPAQWSIDPADIGIASEKPSAAIVIDHHVPAPPQGCLDIAFLGEGYTAGDIEVFKQDLERFAGEMLNHEPYASMKDAICIRGVVAPSSDAGCDEPRRGLWKRTALGASFNALGSERYLLTEDNRALRNLAANVPYDTLIVMVNHGRYGGGGIYNLFCTFTAHNRWSAYLVLHEFGHSFAGLADEYYTSAVAYEDFHPPKSEPLAPNVTALLDPATLKWGDLVDDETALPTSWRKKEYDTLDLAFQAEREKRNHAIEEASRSGEAAQAARLEAEAELLASDHGKKMKAFLALSPMAGKVGAFEGAGYAAKGLYRPTLDCLMFSRGQQPFCPVCRRAVAEMIRRYVDPPASLPHDRHNRVK